MELIRRLTRRVIHLTLPKPQRIESDARCLVQKLAREEAAIRAVRVARLQGTFWELDRLERTARNARLFRDTAVIALRRELGLADYPTALEIADWGVPPTPPKPRDLPTVAELGI